MEDVIYLKNGSIIRGFITEQIPNQSVKIEIPNNSFIIFDFAAIDKITKETRLSIQKRQYNDIKIGFRCLTQLVISKVVSLNVIEQYHYDRHFSTGLGIGFETDGTEYADVPILLDNRYYLTKRQGTPFIYNTLGYAPSYSSSIFGLGIGYRRNYKPNRAFIIEIGYKYRDRPRNYYNESAALSFGILF